MCRLSSVVFVVLGGVLISTYIVRKLPEVKKEQGQCEQPRESGTMPVSAIRVNNLPAAVRPQVRSPGLGLSLEKG